MRMDKYKAISDEDLIILISKSDGQAFEELYERYWKSLLQTAFNIVDDKEAAYDIIQEIFVSLWIRKDDLKIETVSSYLFRATKLKVFEHLRKNKLSKKHIDQISFIESVNSTEEWLQEKELQHQFKKSLSELSDRSKEVFEMSRFKDLSYKEIADTLNISVKTVEGHITKALRKLSRDLRKS